MTYFIKTTDIAKNSHCAKQNFSLNLQHFYIYNVLLCVKTALKNAKPERIHPIISKMALV